MSKMSKEWHAEYARKWQAANREKCCLATARWRARNPDKVREQGRKRDPEYGKLWAKRNRAKRRVIEEKWREANKERYLITRRRANAKYRAANPDKGRLGQQRRRERERNAKSCDKTSANLLCQLISSASRLKCGICGENMPKNDRTIDHVIPLAKGGSGEIWNLRIVHMLCNAKKNAKLPHDELNFHAP